MSLKSANPGLHVYCFLPVLNIVINFTYQKELVKQIQTYTLDGIIEINTAIFL